MPELTNASFRRIPPGCRERLLDHYGPEVSIWLDEVPHALAEAGRRWELTPLGYHDAGHASVLAVAGSPSGERVLLKAWPDPQRHSREISALLLWSGSQVPRVLRSDPETCIAALALIGDRPGGHTRPADDMQRVATTIHSVHDRGRSAASEHGFPTLSSYLENEVRPRIQRRLGLYGTRIPSVLLGAALEAWRSLTPGKNPQTVLHGDLYLENTAYDLQGNPHLLDPLPLYGDADFDWAFWTVYYRLGQSTDQRFALASRTAGTRSELLRSWCLALCLDGLLYYTETGDARAPVMAEVMGNLLGMGQEHR